ncbi:hypothetical protein Pan241w_38490 [Gimesia alba]|uniref:Uncharacterized protein n=1 Tax=Gimesia alba TaxID=2527973 RepID=A0A517RIN8_9PLAN|nr:hypothetical protein [Gimesia alba]QDT43745.1 hypothetical protein Pan241w_38490 [Gimesia alba]
MLIQKLKMIRLTTSICVVSIPLVVVFMLLSARGEPQKTVLSEELQDLIREIEQNEALYNTLKLNLTTSNSEEGILFHKDEPEPKPVQSESEISLVAQGLKFRQEIQSKGRFIVLVSGFGSGEARRNIGNANYTEVGTKEFIFVFDGTTSRHFGAGDVVAERQGNQPQKSSIGGISNAPLRLPNFARPHMFVLRYGGAHVPLSTYLKGIKAIGEFRGAPLPNLREGAVLKAQILGTEECQGLKCTKLMIEIVNPGGTPRSRRELWLAHDRNLIPVKDLFYIYSYSKEIPVAEAIIDEWQEVRPGVWFPLQAHSNRFNSFLAKHEGRQKRTQHVKYDFHSIQLDPKIPPNEFSSLKFPPGTKVKIREDGKIIKTIDAEANEL